MLKEIWCEGDPLRDFTAAHLGYGKGDTLAEACSDLCANNAYFKAHYVNNSYKGCRVFDNEAEARQSHG